MNFAFTLLQNVFISHNFNETEMGVAPVEYTTAPDSQIYSERIMQCMGVMHSGFSPEETTSWILWGTAIGRTPRDIFRARFFGGCRALGLRTS
jgi:hypothetical protein